MNKLLEQAISGEPVTVTLGGTSYPLAYPIQAVILYKQETAALDRQRTAGRPRLAFTDVREMRARRKQLLNEVSDLRRLSDEKKTAETIDNLESLLSEATVIKRAIDEDEGNGDSLFDLANWRKISPDDDPERLLLALWVGLHKWEETGNAHTGLAGPPNSKCLDYRPQLSREDIGQMINVGNSSDVTMAVARALAANLLPRDSDPNVSAPEPIPATATMPSSPSDGSGQ